LRIRILGSPPVPAAQGVSEAASTIQLMDTVVDLIQWRRSRESGPPQELRRLEAAIRRLDEVASSTLDDGGQLEPWVETELLAIMGSLSIDLFDDAAIRAERLADRISKPAGKAVR
jgi:hypothetical protein